MSYKGNKEYKSEGIAKDYYGLTGDGRFEMRYDRDVMKHLNKHRRSRDKKVIINCLKEDLWKEDIKL